MPEQLKEQLGSLPDGFLQFFSDKFPLLVINCFNYALNNGTLTQDKLLKQYFANNYRN